MDEADVTADDVVEAVHAVMHGFRALQYRAAGDAAHGLTHLEGKVLGYYARRPGDTLSDLAVHSQRDKGQLARLVGTLKERGLLEARPDEQDRRVVRLALTDAGRALDGVLHRRHAELAADAVADLSIDERRQLLALLTRVRRRLGPPPARAAADGSALASAPAAPTARRRTKPA